MLHELLIVLIVLNYGCVSIVVVVIVILNTATAAVNIRLHMY